MRNIHVNNPIELRGIQKQCSVSLNSYVNMSIGYDGSIYMLFSEKIPELVNGMFVNTKADATYSMLVLSVDWQEGELLTQEYYNLGRHKMNFHFIQPLKDKILLLGSRTYYRSDGPEQNAVVVDKQGTVHREMCFGDGIEDCIVTEDGRIITSYFDEGIWGNYGWDNPIGSCGLIVWDENGKAVWKAKHPIYDCYAMNVDDMGNLWFYYYDEFVLVKTDFHTDVVYKPEMNGATGFLFTADSRHIIFDGGYDKHSEFRSAELLYNELKNWERTDIICNGEPLLLRQFKFRGSKAVFMDNKNRLFAKQVVQL